MTMTILGFDECCPQYAYPGLQHTNPSLKRRLARCAFATVAQALWVAACYLGVQPHGKNYRDHFNEPPKYKWIANMIMAFVVM